MFGTIRAPLLRAAFARPADPVALGDEMQDAWIGFARNGDPGAAGAAPWRPIGSPGDPVRVFGGAIRSTGLAPDEVRRFWAKLSGQEAIRHPRAAFMSLQTIAAAYVVSAFSNNSRKGMRLGEILVDRYGVDRDALERGF